MKTTLKKRGHWQWEKGSKEYEAMCQLGSEHNNAQFFMEMIETRAPQTIANMAIILINQTDCLLYKQIDRLERDSLSKGGLSEKMSDIRRKHRGNKQY